MEKYIERFSCDWSSDSVRLINTPGQTARQNWLYVQETGYFKTKPPYFTERAGLMSYLIIYTLSGCGRLACQGSEYYLDEGSCAFIDCREHHLYETTDEGWEFLWLHFYGSSSLSLYQEFAQGQTPVVRETAALEKVPGLMRQLIDVNGKRGIAQELRSASLITELVTELVLTGSARSGDTLRNLPQYVAVCADYIDRHFREEITLEMLSEISHISRSHLSREFKQWLGISPKEYLIIARITCAKELLRDSEMSVEEISFSVGVENVSHFINLFKAREGVTPHKFRSQWR